MSKQKTIFSVEGWWHLIKQLQVCPANGSVGFYALFIHHLMCDPRWSRGSMPDSPARAPGSIPGEGVIFFFQKKKKNTIEKKNRSKVICGHKL